MDNNRPERRHPGVFLVFLISLIALAAVWLLLTVVFPAEDALRQSQQTLDEQRGDAAISMQTRRFSLNQSRFPAFSYYPARSGFTSAVLHQDRYYIAGETGILVLSLEGRLLQHVSYLQGLPPGPALSLIVQGESLYALTSGGLARIERNDLVQFLPLDGDVRFTTMAVVAGALLIGAEDGSVYTFSEDGVLSATVADIPSAPDSPISSLIEWRGRLVIGTRDDGLFLLMDTTFQRLGQDQGLPSEVITDLSVDGDDLLVASMAGLVRVNADFSTTVVPATGLLSAVYSARDLIITGGHTGAVYRLAGNRRTQVANPGESHPAAVVALAEVPAGLLILWEDRLEIVADTGTLPLGGAMRPLLAAPYISAVEVGTGDSLGFFFRFL